MKFFPDTFNRIWYRTQSGHDPVPPPAPFNPCRCQLCGSPGSTICPWCNPMEKPMSDVTRPQQDPKPGRTAITALVVADLNARRSQGIAKYGGELKSSNGRDALVDAYQEALDLVMYLRQEIEEREERARTVSEAMQQEAANDLVQRQLKIDIYGYDAYDLDGVVGGCISSSTPLDLKGVEVKPGKVIRVDGDPACISGLSGIPAQTAREFIDSVKINPVTGETMKDTGIVGAHADTIVWDDEISKRAIKKREDLAELLRLIKENPGALKFVKWTDNTLDLAAAAEAESIAQEAHRLVLGDRGAAYGHPIFDMTRSADMVTSLFRDKLRVGVRLEAEDIGQAMVCIKQSRHRNAAKRDNLTDTAGYALTLQMIAEWREANPGVDPRDRF